MRLIPLISDSRGGRSTRSNAAMETPRLVPAMQASVLPARRRTSMDLWILGKETATPMFAPQSNMEIIQTRILILLRLQRETHWGEFPATVARPSLMHSIPEQDKTPTTPQPLTPPT